MKNTLYLLTALVLIGALPLLASPVIYHSSTGIMDDETAIIAFPFTYSPSDGSVLTIRTYGWGGGTDINGDVHSPGGFDPQVFLFSTPFLSPQTLIGENDDAGCGISGAQSGECWDAFLQSSGLAAGQYTVYLTVYNQDPNLNGSDQLTGWDGDVDPGNGNFDSVEWGANPRTGFWAIDIYASDVPEPSTYFLIGTGLLGLAAWRRRTRRSD